MKIVLLDSYTTNPGDISWASLERLGEFVSYDRTEDNCILDNIGDAEIVITNKTPISGATLAAKPNIRYVGAISTGYDEIDVAAAKERSVVVTNVPGYSTNAVAQFTFALLLELCHRVGHHADTVREGRWQKSIDFCYWDFPLVELHGKTMGLVGFGSIGRRVAEIAAAFGMNVLAYSRSLPRDYDAGGVRYSPLPDLFANSDVISLHVPLFDSTRGMIDAAAIATMKRSAFVINTARGLLVKEGDLAGALNAGRIAGYAADVVSCEPILPDNPLIGAKNCFLTPHIAWAPREARQRLIEIAAENLAAYLKGSPLNVVSK